MRRTVVCISATDGARGAGIARVVAERLGFRLIDEVVVLRAAAAAGVEPDVVADAERRRSFLQRLVEGVGLSVDPAAYALVGVPPELAAEQPPTSGVLRETIRTAIEEAASEGNLVIFAHAASMALAQRESVLRVLVTASVDVRRQRLAEERSLDRTDAAKAVAASDRGRADYLKRFYRIDTELPALYDLVVNTDRLLPEEAATLVVAAMGRR